MDLKHFTITVNTKSKSTDNSKINFSIKDNLDYYCEIYTSNETYSKRLVIGKEEYRMFNILNEKTIVKSETENKITESVSDFLKRALCYKRAYDIVDGKIYYVEYFYNINVFSETGYPNSAISKIYYKNDEIAFIEEGYEGDVDFDRYYITSFSNTIDESKFEIPTDYKWIESE